MSAGAREKLIEILLADDDPGDVRLTVEAMKRSKMHTHLSVVGDGLELLAFLRRQGKYGTAERPDIILLDLNMPRMDGREALAELKRDPELRQIPVVILTTSEAEEDIHNSYSLHANCYIAKPVDMAQFATIVKAIDDFWFTVVKLPPKGGPGV